MTELAVGTTASGKSNQHKQFQEAVVCVLHGVKMTTSHLGRSTVLSVRHVSGMFCVLAAHFTFLRLRLSPSSMSNRGRRRVTTVW